ncbi:CCA tRNA nucleotidyltransferase [uncultured Roseobacter sp.]|uniref:CCA tRNA nucleotidyltransferase n=1 Tax=uncultured Roseobacter sp. TaxID=114847 RepID=UPI0026304D23|nr:CCA tRNA nucleotidyltransferase [uncultured Roseobacter sp.]
MDRSTLTHVPADTGWLNDRRVQALAAAFEGAPIYLVGGCVRDAVLGVSGGDVDLATPLLPAEVTRLAEATGFKVVPTGIEHGTVTVVVDGSGFEITSFRKDVETDGRRAVVAFSTDMTEDARRRDFTLNALYATTTGKIIDPLGGLPDCLARRIRFVGEASDRIREDYLRILRFFRFHAWYAAPQDGFDTEALAAIAANTTGLETLSAERIGSEMRRLLAASDPCRAVAGMQKTGVLGRLLPGSDPLWLGPVVHLEGELDLGPDWLRRLVALGGQDVAARLRLTRADARSLDTLQEAMSGMMPLPEIAYRHGYDVAVSALILRAAMAGEAIDPKALPPLVEGAKARFPVAARDLMPALTGKALGHRLASLEARWIASGFRLSREDLMTPE